MIFILLFWIFLFIILYSYFGYTVILFIMVLPKKIFKHRKQGFVGPLANWFRTDLNSYLRSKLATKNLKKHDFFNAEYVNRLIMEHEKRVENHENLLWAILIFQEWYDQYIANSPKKSDSIYTG